MPRLLNLVQEDCSEYTLLLMNMLMDKSAVQALIITILGLIYEIMLNLL